MDPKSEEISKGLFARVFLEVDISKPLKMKIKYIMDDVLIECFVDYVNITNICYGCGCQNHKFNSCFFNTKSVVFCIKRFPEPSQIEFQGLWDDGRMRTKNAKWI